MAKKGNLSCLFDEKSGAATIEKEGVVLASSTNLETPMKLWASDGLYRVGDAISDDPKTHLPKAVDGAFIVDTGGKRCDATLADGKKLERVPMVRHDFAPK